MAEGRSLSWTLGVLTLTGCGEEGREVPGPKPGPPEVVGFAKSSQLALDLFFSEPVAPPDECDPSAFRLSFGIVYGDGSDARTKYEGPMSLLCGTTDYCVEEAEVVGVAHGGDEATIRLTLASWAPAVCEVREFLQQSSTADVRLHYRGGDSCVQDGDGEPLAGFGETWVDNEDIYLYSDGEFPEMPLPIPCPK